MGGLGLLVSGFGMVHQVIRLQNRVIVIDIINERLRYCDIAPKTLILPYSSEFLMTQRAQTTQYAA